MPRKKWFAAPLLLALCLGLLPAIPGFAQGAAGGLVPDGDPPDLFLLYTGDVIGFIDPCG
jgi:hypothetical protein